MQIGFNMLLWTPFVTEEHFPLFAPLKETGYDGVELEIFEGTPDHYARWRANWTTTACAVPG